MQAERDGAPVDPQGGASDSGSFTSPRRGEESEHVVIGRLIRRLRISDPPDRFQELATTVLRSSLGVAAVAWVPEDAHEPVIFGGTVEGLDAPGYRTLPAPSGRETMVVRNDIDLQQSRSIPPGVVRYAAVSAGTLGCLIAVNPLDDRPISPDEVERMQYVASLIETQLANARIYVDLKELLFGIIRGPHRGDRRQGSLHVGAFRARGADRRPARRRVADARREAERPLCRRPAARRRQDRHRRRRAQEVRPALARGISTIQSHVEIGVTILKDLKKLHHILPGVRHHHESYDGTGYPDRLAGESIPYEARILAVADAFDAMSSNRPYRRRLSLMQIDEIFRKGRGQQWDPTVVDALFDCRCDVEAIRQKGLGESLIGAVDVALGRS